MHLSHILLRVVVYTDSVYWHVCAHVDVVLVYTSPCHAMLWCHHMGDTASTHHVVHGDMWLCHTHAYHSIVSHMYSMCVDVTTAHVCHVMQHTMCDMCVCMHAMYGDQHNGGDRAGGDRDGM